MVCAREIGVTGRQTVDDDMCQTQGWDGTSRVEMRWKVAELLRTKQLHSVNYFLWTMDTIYIPE